MRKGAERFAQVRETRFTKDVRDLERYGLEIDGRTWEFDRIRVWIWEHIFAEGSPERFRLCFFWSGLGCIESFERCTRRTCARETVCEPKHLLTRFDERGINVGNAYLTVVLERARLIPKY